VGGSRDCHHLPGVMGEHHTNGPNGHESGWGAHLQVLCCDADISVCGWTLAGPAGDPLAVASAHPTLPTADGAGSGLPFAVEVTHGTLANGSRVPAWDCQTASQVITVFWAPPPNLAGSEILAKRQVFNFERVAVGSHCPVDGRTKQWNSPRMAPLSS
jgi:hypothetical protein